jgi:hypothetical protein
MRLNSSACNAGNLVEQPISFCCPISPHFSDSSVSTSPFVGSRFLRICRITIQPRFVVASGSCAFRVGRLCSHFLSSPRNSSSTPAPE